MQTPDETPQGYRFNQDPAWITFIDQFEPMRRRIAAKYCSDESLREDAMQEAWIALATIHPENVRGYEDFQTGKQSKDEWDAHLRRFCHQVIRNSILSQLEPIKSGSWHIGRTRTMTDKQTGKKTRVWIPPRYSSLEELSDEFGLQISTEGDLTWEHPSAHGLLYEVPTNGPETNS